MRSEARLDAIIDAKRQQHAELSGPLTWAGFQAICEREDIALRSAALPVDAVLLASLGAAAIVINSRLDPRRHTYRGAHELGHLWAGHGSSEPVIYTMQDPAIHDEREDEAEYIATRLLQGW